MENRSCTILVLVILALAQTATRSLAQSQTYQFVSVAGLAGSPGRADGTNSCARFWFPTGVAVDGADNVYVADEGNIGKLTPVGTNWVSSTIAGAAEGIQP